MSNPGYPLRTEVTFESHYVCMVKLMNLTLEATILHNQDAELKVTGMIRKINLGLAIPI